MAPFNGSSKEFAQLQRHDPYYLNGGDIHFLVENKLFRVHRYFFERESSYFRDQLTVPATPGRSIQGTEDSNAILLDVPAKDFARLMWVFYNPKYSLYDASVDDWASILGLAHRWTFREVKKLAIRELEKLELTPIDRIVLYQKYDVDENLLINCYIAVCARDQPITIDEGQKLGIKTAMTLTIARERVRSTAGDGSLSPLPAGRKEEDLHNLVMEMFSIPPPDSSVRSPDSSARSPRPTPRSTSVNGFNSYSAAPGSPTPQSRNFTPGNLSRTNGASSQRNDDFSRTGDLAGSDADKLPTNLTTDLLDSQGPSNDTSKDGKSSTLFSPATPRSESPSDPKNATKKKGVNKRQ